MKYILLFFVVATTACNLAEKHHTSTESTAVNRDSINQVALQDTSNFTSIAWIDSTDQTLGTVTAGQVVDISWRFKNNGTKPLVIANVQPGCGCTVAEKPMEPIAPGGEGVIKAKFDSKGQSVGEHRKNLTVTANTGQNIYLNFKVNVSPQS